MILVVRFCLILKAAKSYDIISKRSGIKMLLSRHKLGVISRDFLTLQSFDIQLSYVRYYSKKMLTGVLK